MPDTDTAGAWRGHELIDRDGEKIGKIAEVYLDQHTGEPAWVTVKTGLFGNRHTLVPIGDAFSKGEIVRVPFEKDHVGEAPNIDPDQELSASEERELYDHYGVDYSGEGSGAQAEHGGGAGHAARGEGRQGREHERGTNAGLEPRGEGQHEHDVARAEHEPRGDHEHGAVEAVPGVARAGEQSGGRSEAGQHDADEPSDAHHGAEGLGTREHGRDEYEQLRGMGDEEAARGAGASTGRVGEKPVGGEGEIRLRLKRYVVTDEIEVPDQRGEVLERDEGEGAGPDRRP